MKHNYYITSDNVFSDWLASLVTFFDKKLCLGEYYVPCVDQSLYSPHGKSSIVYCLVANCISNCLYF